MNTLRRKKQIAPKKRNLQFPLGRTKSDQWNSAGVPFTQFMNTLSIFFPAGERFFIDSIRNYRDRITDESLKKDIQQFIGQEAMHTREHLVYNQALIDAGFPVDRYMSQVERLLKFVQKNTPHQAQLAVTMALEHLTASLGDVLLKNPELLEGSDVNYQNIWNWHAMEEIEHKGVAFDVWDSVIPQTPFSYTLRISAHVIAHLVFWSLVVPYHLNLVRASGHLTDRAGWWSCFKNLWGKPGALRKISVDMLDYFRPGFHPWQKDNRYLLQDIESLERTVHELYEASAA